MSCFHGSKIAGSQQSFLTETAYALLSDGRKVWATSLFLSAIMHKFVHVNFFLSYLQDHGLWRSRNFAIMALWCKQLLLSSVSGLKAYQGWKGVEWGGVAVILLSTMFLLSLDSFTLEESCFFLDQFMILSI